jgi:hypothetical protein
MGTFGKTDSGGSSTGFGYTYKYGTNYQMANVTGQRLKRIYVYVKVAAGQVKLAIYDVPNNTQTSDPSAKMWGSDGFTPVVGWNYVEIPEADRPALTANHWYWLGLKVSSTSLKIGYDSGVDNSGKRGDESYDEAWSDPFGTPTNRNLQFSIYGEYEPSITEKSFSDVSGGSDAFVNPYRAMGFSETGQGSEAFGIPFKALPFADVGHGAEAFNTPFKAMGFNDVGSGVDVFALLRMLAFSDTGLGSDSFTKEILGAIEKAFGDVGYGTDVFAIPLKAMGFADSGYGVDSFSKFITFLNKTFADAGYGSDNFAIFFKALAFSDAANGVDIFTLLRELAFSDLGSGADSFSKEVLGLLLKAFSDAGLGSDAWRGANLIEAPLIIVTVDGKIILRISRATKKEPDYIMLG